MATRSGWLVIGCGDFGAAVLAALAGRGALAGVNLTLLPLTEHSTASRRQAADLLTQPGSRLAAELQRALQAAPTACALVAAADEALSGGLLVAALEWLQRQRLSAPTLVWVALPAEQADRTERSRAYATLLELETLRQTGAFSGCYLYQARHGRAEAAPLFADALLVHAAQSMVPINVAQPLPVVAYAGFGIGILDSTSRQWLELLVRRLAIRELTAYLHTAAAMPTPEALLERWQDCLKGLLTAVEGTRAYRNRWGDARAVRWGGGAYGGLQPGDLQSLLREQSKFYAHYSSWQVQAAKEWVSAREQAEAAVQETLNGLRNGGGSSAAATVRTAAASLARWLRSQASDAARAAQAAGVDYQKLYEELARSQRTLYRTGPSTGERDILDRCDQACAKAVLERYRSEALQVCAQNLTHLCEQAAAQLELRGQAQAAWVEGLQHLDTKAPSRAPHILAAMPTDAETNDVVARLDAPQVRRLLAAGDLTADGRGAAAEQQLLDAAWADVKTALPRLRRVFSEPSAEQKKAWLAATVPTVAFRSTLPADMRAPRFTYRTSVGLSDSWRTSLEEQSGQVVREPSLRWYSGEVVVYSETDAFSPALLASLPELYEAYAGSAAPPRPGLHVLAEPADGWPGLLPEPPLSEGQVRRASGIVLQAILFGLCTPQSDGCQLRYLGEGRTEVVTRIFTDLPQAVRTLAAEAAAMDALQGLLRTWVQALDMEHLAGYAALLSWYMARLFTPAAGSDVPELQYLRDSCVQDLRLVETRLLATASPWHARYQSLAAAIGSADDACSLPTGDWRYLQW